MRDQSVGDIDTSRFIIQPTMKIECDYDNIGGEKDEIDIASRGRAG